VQNVASTVTPESAAGARAPRPGRLLRRQAAAIVVLIVAVLAYLLALVAAENAMTAAMLRRRAPFALDAAAMLAILTIWLATPVAVATLVNWRRRRRASTTMLDLTPHLIGAWLGILFTLLALGSFLAVMFLSPPGWWQVIDCALFALALPAMLRPLRTWSYRSILIRFQTPEPAALVEGLDDVRLLTGFQFDRVMCLRASFGSGKPCFVLLGSSHSTLVISEQVAARLTREQLLAVLLHEAAHVMLDHGNRKLVWGAVGAAGFIGASMAGQLAVSGLIPFVFVRLMIVLMPLGILQMLYDRFVTRRHEAEADEFATRLIGAPAMLGALEALRGPNAIDMNLHNRWTTHGTWARRSARIRAYGVGAADGQ